jgi:hypothetical protein
LLSIHRNNFQNAQKRKNRKKPKKKKGKRKRKPTQQAHWQLYQALKEKYKIEKDRWTDRQTEMAWWYYFSNALTVPSPSHGLEISSISLHAHGALSVRKCDSPFEMDATVHQNHGYSMYMLHFLRHTNKNRPPNEKP